MKILKKINKGLILTIIVLVALTIYLVGVEKQRKADKEVIKNKCEEFVELTNKYLIYPESMQILAEPMPERQKEEYTNQMKTELEKIMIKNDEAVKIQYEFLKAMLENNNTKEEMRTKVDRKITKISSYEFDGNQVTVTFNSKLEIDSKYLNGEEEKTRKNSYETSGEEITLQKIDNEWKVVSSNLRYYGNNYYTVDSDMMVY